MTNLAEVVSLLLWQADSRTGRTFVAFASAATITTALYIGGRRWLWAGTS